MHQRLPLLHLTLCVRRFGGFDDEDELDAAEGLEEEEGQVSGVAQGVVLLRRCMHHNQAPPQEQPRPG